MIAKPKCQHKVGHPPQDCPRPVLPGILYGWPQLPICEYHLLYREARWLEQEAKYEAAGHYTGPHDPIYHGEQLPRDCGNL